MVRHAIVGACAALAAGWLGLAQAAGQGTAVDLELVLAVDASVSMDREEQELQRAGYVAAFRDPALIEAITSGGHGRIAVTYVEWGGAQAQQVLVPWMLIDGQAAAGAFAQALEAAPMGRLPCCTSVSGALVFSHPFFEQNGYEGVRRVVDISGDGPNNQGAPVTAARDLLISGGITINGLPIMTKARVGGTLAIPDLDIYYEDCVIGGPSAFVVPVTDARLFATAIRRKLILEIVGREPRVIPAQFKRSAPRVDCLLGERLGRRLKIKRGRQ